jgi:hypothetical protein
MIAPLVAGAAALYGWYRYKKNKEAKELDALLTAAPAPVPPGFAPPAPSLRTIQSVAGLVKKTAAAQAGLGAPLPQGTYGAGATTADVPSGRIPSSLYGTGGSGGSAPPPAPAASGSWTGSFQVKI